MARFDGTGDVRLSPAWVDPESHVDILQVIGEPVPQAERGGNGVALIAEDVKVQLLATHKTGAVCRGLRRDGDECRAGIRDGANCSIERFKLSDAVRSPEATEERDDERPLRQQRGAAALFPVLIG